jgi:ABC-type antimicrobial peptide transport system permease subunit
VSAAVRDRRRELAMLACLGWPRWRLGATIGGEVVAVGLLAGVVSGLVAGPLGGAVGVAVPLSRARLAVPVAVGLAALAAAVPALQAARAHPGAAVHPAVRAPRRPGRARRHRGVVGMAATNLLRVPGRTALGALALAVGVGGLTMVAAVTWVFHGTVTGSLLGDAVSVRVRGVDAVAVAATRLLGLLAVADVLYLNVRERASELAALRATGWSDAALARLVTFEGLGMGLVGGVLGAGAGLAGAARFAGALPAPLVATAAGVAAGGLALTGLAALVPAQLQRRISMATLLAEE